MAGAPPPSRVLALHLGPVVARELLNHTREAQLEDRLKTQQSEKREVVPLELGREQGSHQADRDEAPGTAPEAAAHRVDGSPVEAHTTLRSSRM